MSATTDPDMARPEINLDSIKSRYVIKKSFKPTQKVTTGKRIPFEQIDKSLYKKQANCVCFLTSETRIHGWIVTLAERLYGSLRQSGRCNVVWNDKEGTDGWEHTEFSVYDSEIASQDGDDFMYKVIVYLTCGKIMVQGKQYESWCDDEFETSLTTVNKLFPEEQTIPKAVYMEDLTPNNTENIDTVGMDEDSENVEKVNNRINIVESALVSITEKVSQMCSVLEIQIKETQTKSIAQKIGNLEQSVSKLNANIESLMAAKETPGDNVMKDRCETLERDLKEKGKMIDLLTSVSKDNENTHKRELERMEKEQAYMRKQVREKEAKISSLEEETWKLREDRAKVNEMIESYEKRLKDRDDINKGLQDRLHNALYDKNGEPWAVQGQHVSAECSSMSYRDVLAQPLAQSPAAQKQATPATNNNQRKQTSQPEVIFVSEESPNRADEIVIIHDSVLNDLDCDRFTAHSKKTAKKFKAPKISDAAEFVTKQVQADTTVIHVGVNDLRNTSADVAFTKYKELLSEVKNKTNKCVISLPLPSKNTSLNDKIQSFNSMVIDYIRQPNNRDNIPSNIKYTANRNFMHDGNPKQSLFRDEVHASNMGLGLLIRNIKYSVFPRGESTENQSSRGGRFHDHGHPTQSSQTQHPRPTRPRYGRAAPRSGYRPDTAKDSKTNELASGLAKAIMDVLSNNK